MNQTGFPMVWRVRTGPLTGAPKRGAKGDRFGQRCRVVVRGALNSVLVEFADGFRVVTSRYYVRGAV